MEPTTERRPSLLLRLTLPGRPYTVGLTFAHMQADQTHDDPRFPPPPWDRMTRCEVWEVEAGAVRLAAAGLAACSKQDRFCKATGRKLALQRALEQVRLSKDERRMVWEAYRKVVQS